MTVLKRRLPWSVLALTLVALGAARADDPPPRDILAGLENFVRLHGEDKGQEIQLSVRRYAVDPARNRPTMLAQPRRDLPEIDLISLIHVAEAGYYKDLNERLAGYDLVLYEAMGYELFKPVDLKTRPTRQLMHQAEALLRTPSWRLADMSFNDQFKVIKVPPELGSAAMKQQAAQLPAMGRGFWLSNVQNLRRGLNMLPKEFIILQRNSIAFAAMIQAAYQDHKRIAVVYGAGHMPDLERRLIEELGYRCSKTDWLTAIHAEEEPPAPAKKPRLY